MGANYDDFLSHIKSIDWYHAGPTHGLTEVLKNGMQEPTLQSPGLPSKVNNIPRLGSYGPGLNFASNLDDIKEYFKMSQEKDPKSAILTAKLTSRQPLVNANMLHGVETPNFRERLMSGLDFEEEKIKRNVLDGIYPDHHGDYLIDKINLLRRGVEANSADRIGQAAPYAGFDSYVTDDHQLQSIWNQNTNGTSLQAVVNKPYAMRALKVRHGSLSEMFRGLQ